MTINLTAISLHESYHYNVKYFVYSHVQITYTIMQLSKVSITLLLHQDFGCEQHTLGKKG